ncbi:hypothetical protein ACRALDRAFT_2088851, partial [Sodiomyces alcalophilus JCM 7366]|uniref:uncharacterized protein n=1 Tax=Sodiomyces alcalophilus JCM 7366 TaxID=591952 RepID=UPI0039B38669
STNGSRVVSDAVANPTPIAGLPRSQTVPNMAGPTPAATRGEPGNGAPRNSSIDSAMSAATSSSNHRKGSQSSQAEMPDIASLIKTAGSPEAVIQYLLKGKQSQSQQNSQLWRLVDKQRAMILGLNKDLERALKDKEKYRKKLKEVMSLPEIAKAAESQTRLKTSEVVVGRAIPKVDISGPDDQHAAPDSPSLESDSQKHSPIDMAMAPYPITPPADRIDNGPPSAMGEMLDPSHMMPKPQEYAYDKFDHEAEEKAADAARHEEKERQIRELPINMSLPPSRSLPSQPPKGPPPKPPVAPPALAATDATSKPDQDLTQFPIPPPRKPPPAPLQLHKSKTPTPEDGDTDSDFDDILEVDEIVLDDRRGRRRTREEDEQARQALAKKETEMRSLSKKSKSQSQTGTPQFATYQNNAASLAGVLNGDRLGAANLGHPLTSGLPLSPRPGGGPRVASPPLSPRTTSLQPNGPLSPRPPRQPIPLPPGTPLVLSPRGGGGGGDGAEDPRLAPLADEPTQGNPPARRKIFKGFVMEEYPDLLLPPNAIPSVQVRVASSRMKPSRASVLSLTQLEEDPVFTLAVFSRVDRGELWRVEKDLASLSKLDQRLKQCPSFTTKAPDRALFTGHAPAKLDARRQALDRYLEELLETPLDLATALEFCKYLSTNVVPPNADEEGRADGGPDSPTARAGPGGRPFRSGYLTKRGKNFGGWKARFFVLDGPRLRYFEAPGGAHLGTIKLPNAQIGKQSQNNNNENQSPASGTASTEDFDNQYRHAFLILEPKKKDSSSYLKHVLCAESDTERDRWVEALLKWIDYREGGEEDGGAGSAHNRHDSGGSERTGAKKKKGKGHQGSSGHQPSGSDGLIGVRYDSTTQGDLPQSARPKTSSGTPDHHHSDVPLSPMVISGPKDMQVISDSAAWGNKVGLSVPSHEEKKQRKRSFFGFGPKTTRSSADGQDTLFGNEGSASSTPPQGGYQGPVRQVFGAPLAEAVRYNAPQDVSVPLPSVVYRCIQYLDANNASLEEGIFRLSGSNVVIKGLRERFNTEGDINLVTDEMYYDIHAVASLLKLYLRELPTTILTRDLHLDFLTVTEMTDRNEKIDALSDLVQRLPLANATLLKYLIAFLIKIINNADINKMTVRNVGIVFSPTLNIPAPVFAMFLQNYEPIFGIPPEEYELPSGSGESASTYEAPSPILPPPGRPYDSQRPGTSGQSQSPHRQRLLETVTGQGRAGGVTPPLLQHMNAARASPTPSQNLSMHRGVSYEPQYANHGPGGGPTAGRPGYEMDPALRDPEPIPIASGEQQNQPRGHSPTEAAANPSAKEGASNEGVASEGRRRTHTSQEYEDRVYSPDNGNPTRAEDGVASAPSHGDSHHEKAATNGQLDASPGGAEDAKRPRACESCRGLKVRCAPDTADPEGPCARCRKAKRNCVVTVPTRKRQKKTDTRVAELEKKIDALTASLHTRTGGAVPEVHQPSAGHASSFHGGGWGSVAVQTPIKQSSGHRRDAVQGDTNNNNSNNDSNSQINGDAVGERYAHPRCSTPPCLAGHKRKLSDRDETPAQPPDHCRPPQRTPPQPPPPIRMDSEYEDVIDRGILTMDKAIELFARYNMHMVRHFPAVVFPATLSAMDLRRTKPLLFLAIMTAASGETSGLQRQLCRELMQILAEKIIMAGEKSLEIVQALHVSVIWYVPPEHFEELKFYQLVHMAGVMAIDIGLGRRTPGRRFMPLGMYVLRKSPYKRSIMPDPTTLEARRAWLGCYLLSIHVAIAMQRPLLLRWTRFAAECVDMLETSPEAAPTDRFFCALVRTHRLAEDIALQLNLDDPEQTINISDPRILFSLRKLGNDLESYFQSVPKEMLQHPCHDSATHLPPSVSTNAATSRPLGLPDAQTLTNAQVNLVSASLAAIDTIIETFLGMDVTTIRCLPVFNFSRVAYSLIVLLRTYSAVSTPATGLATIINKDDIRVDHYLDAVFDKFRAVAAEDKSRAASKFLMIIAMLRGYRSQRSRTEEGGSEPSSAAQRDEPKPFTPPSSQQQTTGSLSASTPLHLLSEIAT